MLHGEKEKQGSRRDRPYFEGLKTYFFREEFQHRETKDGRSIVVIISSEGYIRSYIFKFSSSSEKKNNSKICAYEYKALSNAIDFDCAITSYTASI